MFLANLPSANVRKAEVALREAIEASLPLHRITIEAPDAVVHAFAGYVAAVANAAVDMKALQTHIDDTVNALAEDAKP